MNVLRVLRYGLLVGWQEFVRYWNPYTWLGGWMARILGQAAFFALLGELLDSPDRLRYLLIGNAVVVGATAANWAVPASTWDRGDGTYPLLVIAPSSLLPAIVGRTSIWMANGIASSFMAFVVLAFAFEVPLAWPEVLLIVLLVPLTCASVFCLALFLGSLVTRMPRVRNIVHLNATALTMMICGVSVPVSFWPGWVEAVANVLPLTHGLHAIRLLLDEAAAAAILESAALEVLVGLGWLAVSFLVMDRMADAGRKDGSIEFVG